MQLRKKVSRKLSIQLSWLLYVLVIISCSHKKEETLFELMNDTGVNFINKVEDTSEENCFQFRNYYNGGGVALGDLNNDGLPDLVLTSNLGNNAVYINKGNFKFEDISATCGFDQKGQWSTGVSLVDINHDGWLDIYICSSGHMGSDIRMNQLYINNHDQTFTESGAAYGLNISGYCTQAAFFDYDLDGDLDCFLINNTPIPFGTLNYGSLRDSSEAAWNLPAYLKGGGNHLYKNDKDHFTEVTSEAGLHTSLISFGLGLSVADINQDGYPDVYVGNDFFERDYLYINQKDGTFKDELEQWMQHISMSSMGTDVADINNDGYPDIYTTDMFPYDDYRLKTTGTVDNFDLYRSKIKAGFYHQYVRNCLQVNNRNGKFADLANYAGVAETDWSWGTLLFDADNDGLNDIFVCNGINRDLSDLDFLDYFSNDFYRTNLQGQRKNEITDSLLKTIPRHALPNKMYRNLGQAKFEDVSETWGLADPGFSNAVAYADLDKDGDLDLVINNENQLASVYQNKSNQQNKAHYVSVQLKGDSLNDFAIGAAVKLYAGNQVFYREVQPVRGFQSSVDYNISIGLGTLQHIDSMHIAWPGNRYTLFQNLAVDSTYHISIASATANMDSIFVPGNANSFFEAIGNSFDKHREDDYIDFYQERNIPEMLSHEGPKAAVADVNADGLDDIYIGGATNQPGQLYLQNTNGTYTKKDIALFEQFASFEDAAVLFFDADNDKDVDLFVGAAGNTQAIASRETQLRLYINDGKGNFTLDANAFPNNSSDIGCVAAHDFNNDGFMDLFVGGRNKPREYGISPSSYLFVNDGKGHFKDIAAVKNKDIATIGMVTAAVWEDMNGDRKKELIIAGEWMSPHIFSFNGDHFVEVKTNLQDKFGFWKSMAVKDLDGDGRPDLVLGNIGENFYLRPNEKQPVKLWINDYDQNGLLDKVMTRTINGKDMPVFLKREMQEQLPVLKKLALLHRDYAIKPVQELFSEAQMKGAIIKEVNFVSSMIAYNLGNGQFKIDTLPMEVQSSSVNAIAFADIDHDGREDIITAGNTLHFQPLLGRLDANFGSVLVNKGNRKFEVLEATKSGIQVTGSVKDIATLRRGNYLSLLFLRNDDFPVLYEEKVKNKKLGK